MTETNTSRCKAMGNQIDVETFKRWVATKAIRPASLADVNHTHHKRKLYTHPNTKQPWVAVKGSEADK